MHQQWNPNKTVRIRAFRALNDHEACLRFIEGHRHVLDIVGVKQVASARAEWMENPAAFVILVESVDGTKTYGGARIHAANGIDPLPIEVAVGDFDPKVKDIVKSHAHEGTGEICGLWNSREVAGMGIGSIYLTRCGVTLASTLGLKSLYALCAPYTVKMAENIGYRIESSVGHNGTFYYPKIDLIATTVFIENTETLEHADPEERERVFDLRRNPVQKCLEKGRQSEFYIEYNLQIQDVVPNEFKVSYQAI